MSFHLSRKNAAAIIVGLWSLVVAVPAAADDAAVTRGEYLFNAADCVSCHTDTKHKGAFLAGGPPLATPFGVFYAPNITPDMQYGIGKWDEGKFRRALRSGIGYHGEYLYPVFPYTSFTRMSDGDIADLYAYLRSVKPVAHASKPSEVRFPFSIRRSLWFWRALFFREGPLPPAPNRSAEWQRGRYLAEAAAHCQECHTPRNLFGALEESRAYAGNPDGSDEQDAPNITPDPSSKIASWSVDDIAQLLTDGQTPDFDYVGSGMGDVVKGTGALSKADRRAIAVYIKSLPPIRGEPSTKKPKR